MSVTEIDDGHRRVSLGNALDPAPRRQIVVSFPPVAATTASDRALDFSVTAEIARNAIPKNREVRFVVRPLNTWGKAGEPIFSEWWTFAP